MKRFRDIEQVRQDMKAFMPLNQLIELVDGKPLKRVSDTLYKKHCDLDGHPVDADGTKDSTSSFTVCPPKELFHCFGCGANGDRFEYISEKFHIDHYDAIHKCAEYMGFDLSSYYAELTDEERIIESLYRDNAMARDIAHNKLLNSEYPLQYLLNRGITMDTIEKLKIGYADSPKIFQDIVNYRSLQLDRSDQYYNAILFPINNAYGNMRYFQSRPFDALPGRKYIGAGTSHPLFHEPEAIFGLNNMRKNITKHRGRLVGVEGAPDTIACLQQDILAIGLLGTTFNKYTAELLDKYRVKELILLLDGDKAGRKRSLDIAHAYLMIDTKINLKIAQLPDGDPEEFINKYGVDELKKHISNARHAVQFLIDTEKEQFNLNSPTAKIEFLAVINKYIMSIRDMLVKKLMINYVAEIVGFDPVEIEDYYITSTANTDVALYAPNEEEVLLGEALRNEDFIYELMSIFESSDWYLAKHQKLFKLLCTSEYKDIDSICMLANNNGDGKVITESWVRKIRDTFGNVEFCLEDVQDKLIRRRTSQKVDKLKCSLNDMSQDANITIDQAIGEIYNITVKKQDPVSPSTDQVDETMRVIHERMLHPVDIVGYDLGPNFKKVTKALLGIERETLTVVSANQSVGKTMMVQNWMMHMAVQDKVPSLWFSLEMSKQNMTFRNLSILSGIPLADLRTGNVTSQQSVDNLNPQAIRLRNAPLHMSQVGHDVMEAISIAKKYVMKYNVEVVVIDYLQLQHLKGAPRERHRELGMISKLWKRFSLEMGIAVILISQLSKEALSSDTAEAEHGAGSYEVAQDADNYITLKEKSDDEIDERGVERGNVTINISKNRMGEKGILIDAYKEGALQRMYEI